MIVMPIYQLPAVEIDGRVYTIDDRCREVRDEEDLDRTLFDPIRFETLDELIEHVRPHRIIRPFLEWDKQKQQWVVAEDEDDPYRFRWLAEPDPKDDVFWVRND